jgi:methionine-R-sulfoxide reductase
MKKSILTVILLSAIIAFSHQQTNGQVIKQYDPKRKMSKTPAEWKKILTPNQYYIMVESGTEPPFRNAYDENKEKGYYVSAATGEVLFSSDDKFDSGTGWPSFVKPVDPKKIEIVRDNSDGMTRDEVIERSTGEQRWQTVLYEFGCPQIR